jgi:hypothetical protein
MKWKVNDFPAIFLTIINNLPCVHVLYIWITYSLAAMMFKVFNCFVLRILRQVWVCGSVSLWVVLVLVLSSWVCNMKVKTSSVLSAWQDSLFILKSFWTNKRTTLLSLKSTLPKCASDEMRFSKKYDGCPSVIFWDNPLLISYHLSPIIWYVIYDLFLW